jgi:muramoyltetrapeptide carboxypeptidase
VTTEDQASEPPPLLRPAPLAKGDSIGVVAPSYAPREGWLHRGVRALERAGYGIILDSEIATMRRFERMEDERRAENFMGMWLDPRVKAVIGGTGGYGAARMIPHLEPEVFRRNPKRSWATRTSRPFTCGSCDARVFESFMDQRSMT